MSTWRALLLLLDECLDSWPRELRPLVRAYAIAQAYEWDGDYRDGRKKAEISATSVSIAYSYGWCPLSFRSKYAFGSGSSCWFVDVELSKPTEHSYYSRLNMHIGVSLLAQCYGIEVRWDHGRLTAAGIAVPCGDGNKYRICMTIDKENRWLEFKDIEGTILRTHDLEKIMFRKSNWNWDEIYPAVTVMDCEKGCRLTLVTD